MTEEEYQQHKRRLEEQLRQGVELLQAAFRGALELVWMATAEKDAVLPRSASGSAKSSSSPPPAAPARPRQKRGQLWEDIGAVLDRLPEVFDRDDLVKALGYEPDRSALHRVMTGLRRQEIITREAFNVGRIPARWRKNYEVEEDEEGLPAEEEDAKPPAG
jgi:hypothetical protein